mgnify:CR=1 FL=1|jgi:hypothetical protein
MAQSSHTHSKPSLYLVQNLKAVLRRGGYQPVSVEITEMVTPGSISISTLPCTWPDITTFMVDWLET